VGIVPGKAGHRSGGRSSVARARLGHQARSDAAVNERQNFLNLPRSFDEILGEARGCRLSMLLAHQDLAQLA
jgi:hypothetical protein